MSKPSRRLRVVRTLFVVVGLLLAACYGISWKGIWWVTPRGSFVGLYGGALVVQYWGPAATVTGVNPGLHVGMLSGRTVTMLPPSGAHDDAWRSWIHFLLINHGRIGPGPTVHQVFAEFRLAWLAVTLQVVGAALMFVKTRRPPPGSCPNCGYSLKGLSKGARCPECGA
jgi:hypothetical protein